MRQVEEGGEKECFEGVMLSRFLLVCGYLGFGDSSFEKLISWMEEMSLARVKLGAWAYGKSSNLIYQSFDMVR